MGEAAARAEGASEEEARRAARLRLGNPLRLREESRDVFGFPRLEALARDISLATRRLRRSPGFTVAATLTLALGIGANAALFALVDAVVLRPLPYPDPERLVALWETNAGPRFNVAPANLADYRVPAFESLAAWHDVEKDLSGGGRPETLIGHAVTADFFAVLGVGPVLGRPFVPEEDREGGERVVILSDPLWRSRFGADPAIVGRTIRLDREPRRVVGVLPAGFVTPGGLGSTRPVSLLVPAAFPAELLANRGDHEVKVVARLRPGARLEEARAQVRAVSERLAAQFPDTNGEVRADITALDDDVVRDVRGSLLLLLAAVGAVLAIACLNVANLQVVRALGRRRELAVCVALGAARGRLATGLLVESLLLAALGGASGVGLAYWLLAGLKALAPAGTPRLADAALDARVLAFALLVTVATGLFFGLVPALHASRARPAESLQTGERQHSSRSVLRWRGALLTTEVALALVLLVAATLVVRSVARLQAVDLGFRTESVVAARVKLPAVPYPDAARRLAFFEELERRLLARPGVEAVAFANNLPLRGGWGTGIEVEGHLPSRPGDLDSADAQAVSRGYFRTLGIPLLRGREFEETDREGAPYVGLVNQEFERVFFAGDSALGKRFRRGDWAPWVTVVGVVASLRRDGRAAERTPQIYLPAAQIGIYPVNLADVAVRGAGGVATLSTLLHAEVTALDPEQPISSVMALGDALARNLAPRRFGLALLAGFALTALALTLLGIYGVAAYSVTQRVPELGVRLALGAGRGRILRLVVGDVLGQVVAGIQSGSACPGWSPGP
jgi:predicted permease